MLRAVPFRERRVGEKPMSNQSRMLACALAGGAMLLAAPAVAHHSFAMFDNTRSITLHGKVTLFQWTNPHAYLEVDAEQPGGGTQALHARDDQHQHDVARRGGPRARSRRATW
jgi:hypothetical protein